MKKYVSDVIGLDFFHWENSKIFITAPTGYGKTEFILRQKLSQMTSRREWLRDKQMGRPKMLILCNRRMLRKQYLYDLAKQFSCYEDIEKNVDIRTYQELADGIGKKGDFIYMFAPYEVIVCDECHFFYQDADFNSQGTYPVWRAILLAGVGKQMIFMSATIECVQKKIENQLKEAEKFVRWECINERLRYDTKRLIDTHALEFISPMKNIFPDYSYLKCICVPDEETLCGNLAHSDGKSIIFVEDKNWADVLAEKLIATGNVVKDDICQLNADNLESEKCSDIVKTLAMAGRLIPKILITTAVLDNGISIKDTAVKNIAIFTESKVSFMQMLGRVRYESVKGNLNLFFIPRSAEYFERRENQLKQVVDLIEQVKTVGMLKSFPDILASVFSNDEISNIYRKFVAVIPKQLAYNTAINKNHLCSIQGDFCYSINPLAVSKIEDAYLSEMRFHKMARRDPVEVIVEQLGWIGLDKEDLLVLESTYKEMRMIELKNKLLTMTEFTNEEYQDYKKMVNDEFGKEFFSDLVKRSGSFSKEKFVELLRRLDLGLEETTAEDGTKRYSVTEIEREDEEC